MPVTNFKRDIGVLYIVALLFSAPDGARADGSQGEHVRAKIVAAVESIQPGKPFWLGVHFEIDDAWHLNWINPGDAGLAPSVSWRLPVGFETGELVWPVPSAFSVGPLVIYGYDRELLLISRVTSPADLPPSGRIQVGADVDWLACADACVPGSAVLSADLSVSPSPPRANERWKPEFEQARENRPAPAGNWRVEALIEDERVYVLEVRSNELDVPPIQDCRFYPMDSDVIEHSEPQEFSARHGGFDLTLTRAHMSTRLPDRISGVLVAQPGWDRSGKRRAILIDVPLQPR